MDINDLISRLRKVRPSGNNKFMACCPAHHDKNPSLSISMNNDGVIAIHCFAGCETIDVINEVGLNFSDLFPNDNKRTYKSNRKQFSATEILKILAKDITIVLAAASITRQGDILSNGEMELLQESYLRCQNALEASNGNY